MSETQVKAIMATDLETISPDASLQEACLKMKDCECGVLPVKEEEADRVDGIITDRDIIVRAIASGVDPALALVRDYMTPQAHACRMDDTLKDAAELMKKHNVSRLLVQDENGKTAGILTFGHALRSEADDRSVTGMVHCATGREAA